MSDMIARGMAANAMSSGGGGGGGTTVDAYSKNETDNLLRGKVNASDVYTSQQTDDLLDDKVDKVSGKGLSTNDYTNEDMFLVKTISNKANTNDVNASITNLQNQISETSENVDTINTELMTNAGYSLGMSINPTTFELTMTLKNSTGGTVSSQKVDLPIESMVVSASYANGKLSLKLQNGQTLDTDISAIVAGLVNQNFTIAGIDMKDNIEANELKTALGINTITSDVSILKNDMSTAKSNISTIQNDISGLKTRDSELQSDIDENTTAIEQNKSDILSAEKAIEINQRSIGMQVSKNLFDYAKWESSINSVDKGTFEKHGDGITISAIDYDAYTSPYAASHTNIYKIPVKPNTKYILSWESDNDNDGKVYIFKNAVPSSGESGNNKDEKSLDFETNSNTTFITVRFGVMYAGESITYSNIMIREADITDDTYEPYKPSVNERLTANENELTSMSSKTLISSEAKTVASKGWYRVFSSTVKGTSRNGLILLGHNYGTHYTENYLLAFNCGHQKNEFNMIKRFYEISSLNVITKIRIVSKQAGPQNNKCHIDIYYNYDAANTVYISILEDTENNVGRPFTPVKFTTAEIPEGYTSYEFDLTGKDVFDRLAALETALSQTQNE